MDPLKGFLKDPNLVCLFFLYIQLSRHVYKGNMQIVKLLLCGNIGAAVGTSCSKGG